MSNRPKANRRTVLSMAGLGLVGSGTAIAKRTANSTSSSKSVLAEYDDDSTVDIDTDAWPQSRFDNGNTSYSPNGSPPEGSLSEAWSYDGVYHGPIVSDETVLVTRIDDPGLVALNATDGSERWSVDVDFRKWGTNLAVADGTVYVTANGSSSYNTESGIDVNSEGMTYAFDIEDGTELWSANAGGFSPKITDEFVVVAGDAGPAAIAREDGTVHWEHDFAVTEYYAVAHGMVYASDDYEGTLYAIDVETGETRWTRDFDRGGSLIATEGEVVASVYDTLYVLEPESGETRWQQTFEKPDVNDPSAPWPGIGIACAVTDDAIYIGRQKFYAFDIETGDRRTLSEDGYYTNSVHGDEFYELDETSDGEIQLVGRDVDTFQVVRRRTLPSQDYTGALVTSQTVYGMIEGSDNTFQLVALRPSDDGTHGEDGSDESGDSENSDDSDSPNGSDDDGHGDSDDDC